MTALWTSQELEAATLGKATRPFAASGISINSRSIKPGDLYIAIKGENHDGHDFTAHALAAGAAGALVSRVPEGVGADAPLLMVANAQRGLEDVGVAARRRSRAEIVAITGSVGKTTAKEILRLALGAQGATHASGGSLNNHWGVPLTLASMPRETQYAAVEIGMNHFGEIRILNGFVRPQLTLVTAIAPAHVEYFGCLEAIADAKSEIFESLEAGGTALLPADDAQFDRLKARAALAGATNIVSFGSNAGDARLCRYGETDDGATFDADICGLPVTVSMRAPGRHNALAAVAALAAVSVFGGDVPNAVAALRDFSALKGRGARMRIGAVTLIDESYNANPVSMAAALSLLETAPGRRIVALGDMLELGAASDALHIGLKDAVLGARADAVFLCGPHMKALWQALPEGIRGNWAPDSQALAPLVAEELRANDTVLVKGSNGSKMQAVINTIKERLG